MARDSYRQRVYDAERAAFQKGYEGRGGKLRIVPVTHWQDGVVVETTMEERRFGGYSVSIPNELGGRRMESVEEMQRYVDKLIASAWFKRRWPHTRSTKILPGKGCRRALAFSGLYDRIEMPRWARVEWVVLHEMAHIVSPDGEKHGRWFLAAYIELVNHKLGKAAADALKAELRSRKVPLTIRKGKQAPFKNRLNEQRAARGR